MSEPELRTCSQCGNWQAEGEFCERCDTQFPRSAAAAVAGGAAVVTAAAVGAAPVAPPARPAPPAVPAPPGSHPPAADQPYVSVPPGRGFGGLPRGSFGGSKPLVGFFAGLFDLSFQHLVTPKIIKVLYILTLIGIGLGMLALIISGFTQGIASGFLFVVLASIGGFIYLLLSRLWLEVIVVLFRIEEHTGAMVAQNKKEGSV